MPFNLTEKHIAKFHASYTKGKENECWPWQKGKAWWGHGNFFFNRTYTGAHRIMYALTHNCEIPKGSVVMHTCDNPPCVNPAHLRLGTPSENSLDCSRKGRKAKGERNGNVKLTREQVDEIRATVGKRRDPVFGVHALAKKFGITPRMVRNIVRRLNWNHDGEGSRC